MHVISIVSGVPDNSLKRLVSSSIRPWLRWRKADMDWGRLVYSFSDWPITFSSCGICLWSAFSEDGTIAPLSSAAPQPTPVLLVSGACGVWRLLRRVSGISRFSLVGPSLCMKLEWGLTPTSASSCRGRFFAGIFTGGSGCSGDSSFLCCILCDGLISHC